MVSRTTLFLCLCVLVFASTNAQNVKSNIKKFSGTLQTAPFSPSYSWDIDFVVFKTTNFEIHVKDLKNILVICNQKSKLLLKQIDLSKLVFSVVAADTRFAWRLSKYDSGSCVTENAVFEHNTYYNPALISADDNTMTNDVFICAVYHAKPNVPNPSGLASCDCLDGYHYGDVAQSQHDNACYADFDCAGSNAHTAVDKVHPKAMTDCTCNTGYFQVASTSACISCEDWRCSCQYLSDHFGAVASSTSFEVDIYNNNEYVDELSGSKLTFWQQRACLTYPQDSICSKWGCSCRKAILFFGTEDMPTEVLQWYRENHCTATIDANRLYVMASSDDCDHIGTKYLEYLQHTPGRSIVIGDWDTVLPGCTVQSGGDWAIHYNQRSYGWDTYDALRFVPKVVTELDCASIYYTYLSDQGLSTDRSVVRGSWSDVPAGCTVQKDDGNLYTAFWNTNLECSNTDISYASIVGELLLKSPTGCEAAATMHLQKLGHTAGRDIQVGSFEAVPFGCSIQTDADNGDWTVYLNSKSGYYIDDFTMVPSSYTSVSRYGCLEAGNAYLKKIAKPLRSDYEEDTYDFIPSGCSVRLDSYKIHWNTYTGTLDLDGGSVQVPDCETAGKLYLLDINKVAGSVFHRGRYLYAPSGCSVRSGSDYSLFENLYSSSAISNKVYTSVSADQLYYLPKVVEGCDSTSTAGICEEYVFSNLCSCGPQAKCVPTANRFKCICEVDDCIPCAKGMFTLDDGYCVSAELLDTEVTSSYGSVIRVTAQLATMSSAEMSRMCHTFGKEFYNSQVVDSVYHVDCIQYELSQFNATSIQIGLLYEVHPITDQSSCAYFGGRLASTVEQAKGIPETTFKNTVVCFKVLEAGFNVALTRNLLSDFKTLDGSCVDFYTGAIADTPCQFNCALHHATPIASSASQFEDCKCNTEFLNNGYTCIFDCKSRGATAKRGILAPQTFDDCECDRQDFIYNDMCKSCADWECSCQYLSDNYGVIAKHLNPDLISYHLGLQIRNSSEYCSFQGQRYLASIGKPVGSFSETSATTTYWGCTISSTDWSITYNTNNEDQSHYDSMDMSHQLVVPSIVTALDCEYHANVFIARFGEDAKTVTTGSWAARPLGCSVRDGDYSIFFNTYSSDPVKHQVIETQADCEAMGTEYLDIIGKTPGRSLVAGDWIHVPHGCSIQTIDDIGDWAIHWNNNTAHQLGKFLTDFTVIPSSFYRVPQDKCKEMAMKYLTSESSPADTVMKVGNSASVPSGCSIDKSYSPWVIQWNTNSVGASNSLSIPITYNCEQAATEYLLHLHRVPGRSIQYVVQPYIPTGCSVFSAGDWTIYNNTETIQRDHEYTRVTAERIYFRIDPVISSQSECEWTGNIYVKSLGQVASRALFADRWTVLPPGCSVQTNGDYTLHYNFNAAYTRDITGLYTRLEKRVLDSLDYGDIHDQLIMRYFWDDIEKCTTYPKNSECVAWGCSCDKLIRFTWYNGKLVANERAQDWFNSYCSLPSAPPDLSCHRMITEHIYDDWYVNKCSEFVLNYLCPQHKCPDFATCVEAGHNPMCKCLPGYYGPGCNLGKLGAQVTHASPVLHARDSRTCASDADCADFRGEEGWVCRDSVNTKYQYSADEAIQGDGTTITDSHTCELEGRMWLKTNQFTPQRSVFVGSWTHVPIGCQSQTGGDYTIHFNTRTSGDCTDTDCSLYTEVKEFAYTNIGKGCYPSKLLADCDANEALMYNPVNNMKPICTQLEIVKSNNELNLFAKRGDRADNAEQELCAIYTADVPRDIYEHVSKELGAVTQYGRFGEYSSQTSTVVINRRHKFEPYDRQYSYYHSTGTHTRELSCGPHESLDRVLGKVKHTISYGDYIRFGPVCVRGTPHDVIDYANGVIAGTSYTSTVSIQCLPMCADPVNVKTRSKILEEGLFSREIQVSCLKAYQVLANSDTFKCDTRTNRWYPLENIHCECDVKRMCHENHCFGDGPPFGATMTIVKNPDRHLTISWTDYCIDIKMRRAITVSRKIGSGKTQVVFDGLPVTEYNDFSFGNEEYLPGERITYTITDITEDTLKHYREKDNQVSLVFVIPFAAVFKGRVVAEGSSAGVKDVVVSTFPTDAVLRNDYNPDYAITDENGNFALYIRHDMTDVTNARWIKDSIDFTIGIVYDIEDFTFQPNKAPIPSDLSAVPQLFSSRVVPAEMDGIENNILLSDARVGFITGNVHIDGSVYQSDSVTEELVSACLLPGIDITFTVVNEDGRTTSDLIESTGDGEIDGNLYGKYKKARSLGEEFWVGVQTSANCFDGDTKTYEDGCRYFVLDTRTSDPQCAGGIILSLSHRNIECNFKEITRRSLTTSFIGACDLSVGSADLQLIVTCYGLRPIPLPLADWDIQVSTTARTIYSLPAVDMYVSLSSDDEKTMDRLDYFGQKNKPISLKNSDETVVFKIHMDIIPIISWRSPAQTHNCPSATGPNALVYSSYLGAEANDKFEKTDFLDSDGNLVVLPGGTDEIQVSIDSFEYYPHADKQCRVTVGEYEISDSISDPSETLNTTPQIHATEPTQYIIRKPSPEIAYPHLQSFSVYAVSTDPDVSGIITGTHTVHVFVTGTVQEGSKYIQDANSLDTVYGLTMLISKELTPQKLIIEYQGIYDRQNYMPTTIFARGDGPFGSKYEQLISDIRKYKACKKKDPQSLCANVDYAANLNQLKTLATVYCTTYICRADSSLAEEKMLYFVAHRTWADIVASYSSSWSVGNTLGHKIKRYLACVCPPNTKENYAESKKVCEKDTSVKSACYKFIPNEISAISAKIDDLKNMKNKLTFNPQSLFDKKLPDLTFDIPLLVLRDPPGDSSTASLSKGTTIDYSISLGDDASHQFAFGSTLNIGYEASLKAMVAPLGLGTSFNLASLEGGAGKSGRVEFKYEASDSKSVGLSASITETISTSGVPELSGRPSDLLIGASHVTKAASIVNILLDQCNINISPGDTITRLDITEFVYSRYELRRMVVEGGSELDRLQRNLAFQEKTENGKKREELQIHIKRLSYEQQRWSNILQALDSHETNALHMASVFDEHGFFGAIVQETINLYHEDNDKFITMVNKLNVGEADPIAHAITEMVLSSVLGISGAALSGNFIGAGIALAASIVCNTIGAFYIDALKAGRSMDIGEIKDKIKETISQSDVAKLKEIQDYWNEIGDFRSHKISFDGGSGGIALEWAIAQSQANSYEYAIEINTGSSGGSSTEMKGAKRELLSGSGGASKIAGIRFTGDVDLDLSSTSLHVTRGTSKERQKSYSVAINLEDQDAGDKFLLDIKIDPWFNTPIYSLEAAVSSCTGWESSILDSSTGARDKFPNDIVNTRDRCSLTFGTSQTVYTANSLSPDRVESMVLTMINTSPTEESRPYMLVLDDKTNPNNLIIELDGIGDAFASYEIQDLPYMQPHEVLLTFRRPDNAKYSFEGITFFMTTSCEYPANMLVGEDYLRSAVTLNVEYLVPCFGIEFLTDYLLINSNDDYELKFRSMEPKHLFKYDPNQASSGDVRQLRDLKLLQKSTMTNGQQSDFLERTTDEGFKMTKYSSIASPTLVTDPLVDGPTAYDNQNGYGAYVFKPAQWGDGVYQLKLQAHCASTTQVNEYSFSDVLTVEIDTKLPEMVGSVDDLQNNRLMIQFSRKLDCLTVENDIFHDVHIKFDNVNRWALTCDRSTVTFYILQRQNPPASTVTVSMDSVVADMAGHHITPFSLQFTLPTVVMATQFAPRNVSSSRADVSHHSSFSTAILVSVIGGCSVALAGVAVVYIRRTKARSRKVTSYPSFNSIGDVEVA